MSTTAPYPIHTGVWTNWSNGPVLGATLTLTASSGRLLVAFIAFFVTIIGNRLWYIICFVLHHAFSRVSEPQDAIYHQRQATLRSNVSPGNTAMQLFLIMCAWGRRDPKAGSFFRLVPFLGVTLAVAFGLAVASGFSSSIAVGSEALIRGTNCGWLPATTQNSTANYDLLQPNLARSVNVDTLYGRECYPGTDAQQGAGGTDCNRFARPNLPYHVSTDASCPFSGDICKNASANMLLDSGLIDSHRDIGINAPPSQRFQYRVTLECAPLKHEGFTTIHNTSSTRSNTRYNYGPVFNFREEFANYTFEASNDAYEDAEAFAITGAHLDFTLTSLVLQFMDGSLVKPSSFSPIPELIVPDAFVYLIFLSANGVLSSAPSKDPWFSFTTSWSELSSDYGWGNTTVYRQDTPASPMGCVHRQQYCKPRLRGPPDCSPLTSPADFPQAARGVFSNDDAFSRIEWFDQVLSSTSTAHRAVEAGKLALVPRGSRSPVQQPIPDDQWQTEVNYWFSTQQYSLQRTFPDTASGPRDPALEPYKITPQTDVQQDLCASQIVFSSDHLSFSLLGLLLTVVVGVILIVTSATIDFIVNWAQKLFKSDRRAHLEWRLNHNLQLQRLAHEALGLGGWTNGARTVPTTQPGTRLGFLDSRDPDNPRLCAPLLKYEAGAPQMGTHLARDQAEKNPEETIRRMSGEAVPRSPATSWTQDMKDSSGAPS